MGRKGMRRPADEIPDLPFSNWMMFDRVMKDEAICAKFLKVVLGIDVGRIEYIESERSMTPRMGAKQVRMDIFARDGERMYNVEMQTDSRPRLGRRLRYYQGAMDSCELEPGDSYDEIPDSYIVFLCLDDPFGEGIPIYTIRPACEERPRTRVGSGQVWIALNASAWESAPPGELREVLQYTQRGRVPDGGCGELVSLIDGAVARANGESAWKEKAMGFMTLEHNWTAQCNAAREEGLIAGRAAGLAEGEAAGRAEGESEGKARFARLADMLLDANRIDDLKRAANDEAFRDRLIEELGV